MLQVRVIPCLLLRDGSLVKTVKFKDPGYIGDPVNAIKIYNEKEVDELIFLDITASRERRSPRFDTVREIADECFMPLTYGGGIRTVDDIREIFNIGAEKVCLNTAALHNPDFIGEAAATFGNQSIVVSIDVKKAFRGKYEVYNHVTGKSANIDAVDFAVKAEHLGAGELLVTSVDKEGTWEGYDVELLKKITSCVSVPVIANGGAGSIEDFARAVTAGGASAVAAGSMVVYQKKDLGVLINFPGRDILDELFFKDPMRSQ
ncbi:MAG: imidazole glycerol phosphate synthase subunit HisF [Candidatus Zixiibacteriota bacterium]|nr:MAG: imidazole glycerol phosphate synthase subunit HisF [candidate division Zixibacteria bacterium]